MIQIFLKFICKYLEKDFDEIHPNFRSIVSGSMVMGKFLPFYLFVFPKDSAIYNYHWGNSQ